tara:strand:+ start:2608 stop:3189 length:582 start_codon:yes stop_codon:yes gene_type:complete
MIKLGVIGSTKGTDLQFIIDAIKSEKVDAQVAVVVSNKRTAYILERARINEIPSVYISHKSKKREDFDSEISVVLRKYDVELVLLIGFMRILSTRFCADWSDKVLNVHPSLLPKYAGGMDTNVHEQVIENNDKETGCTIHFVTDELDAGPILIQKKCKVNPDDTIHSLKFKVQQLEGAAFLEAIEIFNSDKRN